MKFALKYPDLFCSGNSHSGAVAFGHKSLAQDPKLALDDRQNRFTREFARVVGENPIGGPDDPLRWRKRLPS